MSAGRATFNSGLLSGADEQKIAIRLCVAFAVVAALAAIFGQRLGFETSLFVTVVAIVWSLCDLLTAVFLLLMSYVTMRPALAVIGAGYIFTGLLTWPYLLTYLSLVKMAAPPLGDQQVSAMLYIIWHVAFALVVIVATRFERFAPRIALRSRALAFAFAAAGGAIAAAALVGLAVYAWRASLPVFIVHGIFQRAYWAVGIPLVIFSSAAGCIVLLTQKRDRSRLTTWLSVALFTSLLDGLLNVASPIRSSYSWDVGKLLTVSTAMVLMVFFLLENARLHVRAAENLEDRMSRGAARLRAIWQIATSESTSESAHLQMILDVATAHIRPGPEVLGVLSHLHDGRIVVDAHARHGASPALDVAAAAFAPGRTFLPGDDVHALLDARGCTSFWADSPEVSTCMCTRLGLRSIIGSPIYVGNQTHFIAFYLMSGLSAEPFLDSDVAFVDVVASNVGHRFHQRSQLERLQYQIEHDSLTALYNRTQFLRLGRMKAADGTLFGIIAIDLDKFRGINERAGQMIGDELLIEIAARLRHVDERDIVARLGADDFAVLLVSDTGDSLEERLGRYESAFREPFHTGDRDGKVFLGVAASLGGARLVPGTKFDEAFFNANVALDAAKSAGGAAGMAFGPELEHSALERILESKEVRAALHNDEFVLQYQPTVDMITRSIVAAEALVRWQHPTRGFLPPSAFLGSVKRANLLAEMTSWVMRRVARDLERSKLPPEFRVYFNVPAQVLESESFLGQLETLLGDYPMLTHRLGVEVTESEVMSRVERAIETLQGVRRLGIRVAIDDFGTGYSSLSYLKRLPIDSVKLDKSFIDGLPDDEGDIALAKMFLALTKQFNFVSVAEGVENENQARWLQEHGCMVAQGYLFSKPIPFRDLIALLGRHPAMTNEGFGSRVEPNPSLLLVGQTGFEPATPSPPD